MRPPRRSRSALEGERMSEISTVADRLAIIDVVTRMFVDTDQKRWDDLLSEVFTAVAATAWVL